MLGSIIQAILSGVITPIAAAVSDVRTQQIKAQADGFKAAVSGDAAIDSAFLAAHAETNRIKLAQQTSPWMSAIAFGAGATVLAYFASIVLDSMFHFGWQIAKLPAPWDGYAWIVLQSFVVLTPAKPLISATAVWLGRTR